PSPHAAGVRMPGTNRARNTAAPLPHGSSANERSSDAEDRCGVPLRRGYEASALAFKKLGKRDCSAILKIGPDNLHADWQAQRRAINGNGGCRGTAGGCGGGPHEARIVVGVRSTIDLQMPRLERLPIGAREREDNRPG